MFRWLQKIFKSRNQKTKLPNNEPFNFDEIAVGSHENIYEALEKRGLLVRPRFPASLGLHLIKDGEIGLCLDNGHPKFLMGGARYTFWSIFNKFLGTKSLTEKVIQLGSIQIVTINQGEIGLSVKNGVNKILEPGRYIFRAPHQFVKSVPLNEPYIELGTHRRITVPAGHVAIAFDKGKQIIITPEQTKEGPYTTDSPTFSFDPATGFKSTQIEEIKLDKLSVNTNEMIALNVVGLIRYQIVDPQKAFFNVDKVHEAIKLQAESTLTSVFAQLSIDKVGTGLSTSNVAQKTDQTPHDLIHEATDLFIKEFKKVVLDWGIDLKTLNILSMEPTDRAFLDTLRMRAQKRIEADTNLVNLKATNEVALQQSEREAKQKALVARGEADAIKIKADAELYAAEQAQKAAKMLEAQPLAAHLAVLKGQADVARAMGNNTVFMPHNMGLGQYGIKDAAGRMFFGQVNAQDQAKTGSGQQMRRASSFTQL